MIGEPVIDPRTIRSDLKDGLADFLVRACASERAERFATASEMQSELRKIREEW
jgi:hypothetical protein